MQGKTINGFELKRPLGVGGMAEVWYAENKIGKKAAVKLLLPQLCQDENLVSRFLTEARVMVELNHPNIRQVNDYGEIDGRPAIVMEYLEGEDLKARMKRGQRFTDEELKKWWNQLVDALNYTHSKGIVHRDIKPGNIFVDTEGNVKLLDFGIAKVRDSISTTLTGQKLGTLMYMSPEQVKDSKHIDYKTDIYSLAVTFVHLITGKKPYDSDTSSDYDIQVSIVTKPMDLCGLPDAWRSFLEPYLNKEPQSRPDLRYFTASKKNTTPKITKPNDEETIVDEVKPKHSKTAGRKPSFTTKKKTSAIQKKVTDEEPEIIKTETAKGDEVVVTKGGGAEMPKENIVKPWAIATLSFGILLFIGNLWAYTEGDYINSDAFTIVLIISAAFVCIPSISMAWAYQDYKSRKFHGTTFQKQTDRTKFCKKCGSPINYKAQYCRICGNRIS